MKKITLEINNSKQTSDRKPLLRSITPKNTNTKNTSFLSRNTSTNSHPHSSQTQKNDSTSLPKRKRLSTILKVFFLLLVVGVITVAYLGYRSNRALNIMGINTNPSSTIANVIKQKEPELKKDENGRTNMLIVGIDTRPNDPGLQNTDSIMIASFDHKTNNTVMISIPRDILVAYPDNQYYYTKINAIYNYCERENSGTGITCLGETVKDITGLSPQYSVMVDIAGMVKIIDILGGVDVEVERSFTDYMFPTPQNTYETIHFDAGLQRMDGETAMKFARSRHAQSVEGSDYARARRQQKIVLAAKEKALTVDTLKNPLTVVEILEELGKNIQISEITTEDLRAGINLLEKIDSKQVFSVVLDPTVGNWQLIGESPAVPKAGAGNWTEVNSYLSMLYEHPVLYTSDVSVYVYNAGLGYNETYQEYLRLTQAFPYLSIIFGGNSAIQTASGTTIYNYDTEPNTEVLTEYSEFLSAEWSSTLPEGLAPIYRENIAILYGAAPIPSPDSTIE